MAPNTIEEKLEKSEDFYCKFNFQFDSLLSTVQCPGRCLLRVRAGFWDPLKKNPKKSEELCSRFNIQFNSTVGEDLGHFSPRDTLAPRTL